MLKSLEISGFKSFANQHKLEFDAPISTIVGPNGSGKSNAAEAFRFVLGEQSLKALRVSKTEELLFNGGQSGRRRNRAHVKAKLNNSSDILDIDYDEVVVERVIERGDASTYRLNGSRVRLKDVTDLLADANIGTSRHHIISQGEADRILNITNRQRKSVIEDALGLGGYYRRRQEAQNKLARTEDNLEEIQAQLEEIKPEFEYLEKKKRRIKKTKELRQKLTDKYQQYFRRQEELIARREENLQGKEEDLKSELGELESKIKKHKNQLHNLDTEDEDEDRERVTELQQKLSSTADKLEQAQQNRAELTGSIQTLKQRNRSNSQSNNSAEEISIARTTFENHKKKIQDTIDSKNEKASEDVLNQLITQLQNFWSTINVSGSDDDGQEQDKVDPERIAKLKEKKEKASKRCQDLKETRDQLKNELRSAREETSEKEKKRHKLEKKLLKLESSQETTETKLKNVRDKLQSLADKRERIEDEKSEAKVLCGPDALEYTDVEIVDENGNQIAVDQITEKQQRDFSRQLERLKVKLEDTRVSDPKEVESEFERVKERIEFFQEEIEDLTETQSQLRDLIDNIEETAERKFMSGIEEINETFDSFFSTMFGGGAAELQITNHPAGRNITVDEADDTPDEVERGVDIKVKLPNKKIRGLDVLSGGERALASVALLFALSQINPPPFMVLDEADAALDEANSRRFGDIVEKLSEQSQLIIITHNRETMRRADLLYGVTMDNDGSSRLLSLDFSEAVDNIKSQ